MIAIAFIAGFVLSGLAVGMYYITVNRKLRRQIKALEHALWIERSENENRIFEAITTALGYETDEQERIEELEGAR